MVSYDYALEDAPPWYQELYAKRIMDKYRMSKTFNGENNWDTRPDARSCPRQAYRLMVKIIKIFYDDMELNFLHRLKVTENCSSKVYQCKTTNFVIFYDLRFAHITKLVFSYDLFPFRIVPRTLVPIEPISGANPVGQASKKFCIMFQ